MLNHSSVRDAYACLGSLFNAKSQVPVFETGVLGTGHVVMISKLEKYAL